MRVRIKNDEERKDNHGGEPVPKRERIEGSQEGREGQEERENAATLGVRKDSKIDWNSKKRDRREKIVRCSFSETKWC